MHTINANILLKAGFIETPSGIHMLDHQDYGMEITHASRLG